MQMNQPPTARYGLFDSITGSACRAVVPCYQRSGMVDQIVVSHGIYPTVVAFGQYDCFVGFGADSVEACSVGRGKTLLLAAKRNNGDQSDVGQ